MSNIYTGYLENLSRAGDRVFVTHVMKQNTTHLSERKQLNCNNNN